MMSRFDNDYDSKTCISIMNLVLILIYVNSFLDYKNNLY